MSLDNLIELAPPPPPITKNDLDNDGDGGVGGGGFTAPAQQPFQYPPNIGGAAAGAPPFSYNIPAQPPQQPEQHSPDTNEKNGFNDNLDQSSAPPPYFPPDKPPLTQDAAPPAPSVSAPDALNLPDLPPVPSDTPLGGNTPQGPADDDDIDFDDLTKRFEALKKKK